MIDLHLTIERRSANLNWMDQKPQWGWIYVTFENEDEAQKIARTLVEENRIACANIFGQVHSIYRWKGVVESSSEVSGLLKANLKQFDNIQKRIRELHSYNCPCIVAVGFHAVEPHYGQWLAEQTGG